jgi:hypothetical protein
MNQPFSPITWRASCSARRSFVMLVLMLIEASLSAATTYLVIEAGRDVAKGTFLLADLMWILAAQSAAYIVGALSWIFAERTGFLAYARYMMRFARDNPPQDQTAGRQGGARTGRAVSRPARRSSSISICSTRSRGSAHSASRSSST